MKKYIGKYLTINSIKDVMYDIAMQEIEEMSEERAIDYLMNEAIPINTPINHLIYWEQTEQIAYEFYKEILELMYERYNDYIPYKYIETLNDITWFAWEYIVFGNENNINEIIKLAKDKGIINE